jgi:hypothetical protein
MTNFSDEMGCPDRELNPVRHKHKIKTLSVHLVSSVFGVSTYQRPDWFIPDNFFFSSFNNSLSLLGL